MPYSSNSSSDLRTVLTQIKEIKESMKTFDSLKESSKMLDDNMTILGDEMFNRMKEMEARLAKNIEDSIQPLVERVDALEGKIDELFTKDVNVDATPPSKRRKIPRNSDLSHHVRNKLNNLGLSWNTSLKETDADNQQIVTRLLREVKEISDVKNNALCTDRRIRDAISSTYKTAKKRERRQANGEEEEYKKKQRNLQRLDRKLKKRRSALTEQEKESPKGQAVHISLMSSDESDEENLVTRPLTWRNEELSCFFKELDSRYAHTLTPSHRRMVSQRITGEESNRTNENVPESLRFWVS